jgi:2-succinyl-5-enolpyruvyl-6-hydroxy-3-cyclohexene-1-carboxylate synthase
MYSNHDNINILTSLLVSWGVRQAVVCPGSRNAPIVHNLYECPDIECFAVTDERSAGFFALGQCQVEDVAVVICVTSGSALLNVAPAVAEAYYQHRRLIVISADRPACMIDQLQGQTLPQPDALRGIVKKSVSLPEIHDGTDHWYCNRLVNEALIEAWRGEGGPVHINVPITEPLFGFDVEQLPAEREIVFHEGESNFQSLIEIANDFKKAKRPMILIGQMKPEDLDDATEDLLQLEQYTIVLNEKLGNNVEMPSKLIDEMLVEIEGDEDYLPDFIVYMGDTFVSKRLKAFLQRVKNVPVVMVNRDGAVHDVFMNMTALVQASAADTMSILASVVTGQKPTAYLQQWQQVYEKCAQRVILYDPPYSQLAAVRGLFAFSREIECDFHFANSMAVRLGELYSDQYIFVNRGVNGIEGCLSTAVGYASAVDYAVFCVIGDLSFFYDQNALWNNNLTSNLRILLLNNSGGGIFSTLPGLKESGAAHDYIQAAHKTTAEGICMENNVLYYAAHNEEELTEGLQQLCDTEGMYPMLLEVFTDMEEDEKAFTKLVHGDKKEVN